MLELHKSYVMDDNQRPIAIQIPVGEFEQIEDILENVGLVKLMEEEQDDEKLSKQEAMEYYQSLKSNHVEN